MVLISQFDALLFTLAAFNNFGDVEASLLWHC